MRISDWSSDVCSSDLIEPMDPEARCTPQSIASHTLYENANPFLIKEPGGTLDTLEAHYEALDDRRVRVRNSRFQQAERSEERRVGKECVSTCSSRWAPYH